MKKGFLNFSQNYNNVGYSFEGTKGEKYDDT